MMVNEAEGLGTRSIANVPVLGVRWNYCNYWVWTCFWLALVDKTMSAQEICAKRMGEVEARQSSKKDAIAALFTAYPDIRAWAKDLKDAGLPVKIERFSWTINGPSQIHTGYAATVSTPEIRQSFPKKAKGGSGAGRKRCNR